MESRLQITAELRAELEHLACAGYPNESCGLLLGHAATGECVVQRVRSSPNQNVERAEDRFELDPGEYMAAEREAARRGLAVVGVWHSHPDHPAQPSPTDREWAWPDWSYVIVAVGRQGVEELRSWRLHGGEFTEEEVANG